jgi:hypothetical protein
MVIVFIMPQPPLCVTSRYSIAREVTPAFVCISPTELADFGLLLPKFTAPKDKSGRFPR